MIAGIDRNSTIMISIPDGVPAPEGWQQHGKLVFADHFTWVMT
jgi:hypothetical protein